MKLYRVVLMGLLITFLSLGTAYAGMFDSLTKKPGGVIDLLRPAGAILIHSWPAPRNRKN